MRRLAIIALLSGCSTGIDYDHFASALIDARCAYFVRCGVAASAAECRAFYERVAVENPSTNAAIDDGKVEYHEGVVQDCFDAYAALSCDQTLQAGDELDVCNGVLTGTVTAGGTCAFNVECESKNCVVPTCGMACCTGTCAEPQVLPGRGEACTALCADGLFCDVDSTCKEPLAEGAACSAQPCAYGLYCAGLTPTMAGRCTKLPHIGQPCTTACAEVGATCYGGSCVAFGLEDDACTADAQCSMFYECNSMQCTLLPTLAMPCRTTCYEAAYCDGTTCVAQKENGLTCLRNDECESHLCQMGVCADAPLCF